MTEVSATGGDVLARYTVRRDESAASAALVTELVRNHSGPIEFTTNPARTPAAASGVGIVEGWRVTIVRRVELDDTHHITRANSSPSAAESIVTVDASLPRIDPLKYVS